MLPDFSRSGKTLGKRIFLRVQRADPNLEVVGVFTQEVFEDPICLLWSRQFFVSPLFPKYLHLLTTVHYVHSGWFSHYEPGGFGFTLGTRNPIWLFQKKNEGRRLKSLNFYSHLDSPESHPKTEKVFRQKKSCLFVHKRHSRPGLAGNKTTDKLEHLNNRRDLVG